MPYTIDADALGRFAIEFVEEPTFIRGFRMAPEQVEPDLMTGSWLLLSFAIWNSRDRPAIDDAVLVAKQFGGRFRLGVRPFELTEELTNWLPTSPTASLYEVSHQTSPGGGFTVAMAGGNRTPFWHWLSDGVVVACSGGHLNPHQLATFADECLSATPNS